MARGLNKLPPPDPDETVATQRYYCSAVTVRLTPGNSNRQGISSPSYREFELWVDTKKWQKNNRTNRSVLVKYKAAHSQIANMLIISLGSPTTSLRFGPSYQPCSQYGTLFINEQDHIGYWCQNVNLYEKGKYYWYSILRALVCKYTSYSVSVIELHQWNLYTVSLYLWKQRE